MSVENFRLNVRLLFGEYRVSPGLRTKESGSSETHSPRLVGVLKLRVWMLETSAVVQVQVPDQGSY